MNKTPQLKVFKKKKKSQLLEIKIKELFAKVKRTVSSVVKIKRPNQKIPL